MKHLTIIILLLNMSIYTVNSIQKQDDSSIEKKLLDGALKYHSKLKINSEVFSESPLNKKLLRMLGEVAMYNADRWLETNMVPPVVINEGFENGKETLSLLSLWIEPITQKITSTDHLKSLVSQQEWSQMNILYFLLGQYDRYLGNQIISKENGKLCLIDNEAIAHVNQVVVDYSPDKKTSCAWVAIRTNDELPNEDEPNNFLEVINTKQDPAKIHAAFDDEIDIWTKRDIDNNNCRIWKKKLWRQFYVFEKYMGAPFCETISLKLYNKIKSLDEQTLISFWPDLPIKTSEENLAEYKKLIERFAKNTLNRKGMILKYFEKHQENILN